MKIRGKKRTKELLTVLTILSTLVGTLTAINLRIDVATEKGKVKNISVLVGNLAKAKQECEK